MTASVRTLSEAPDTHRRLPAVALVMSASTGAAPVRFKGLFRGRRQKPAGTHMLTSPTEPTDSPSSRHINTERVSLFGAQSLASDTQLIDSEKCAHQLSQKAGMCMGLCSGDRRPIKKTSVMM